MTLVPFIVLGVSFFVICIVIPFVAGALDILREEKRSANLSRKEERNG
ncbi:MAG: hypothetical protein ACOYEU_03435 [Limnochordia bacterium]|jgi:hypothetical protein